MGAIRSMRWALLACALGVPLAGQAQSTPAYAGMGADLRAGPDEDFPLVARVGAGAQLSVLGCLEGYSWCDVLGPYGARGWAHASDISYSYQNQWIPVESYASYGALPILSFIIGDYWGQHYRARPFYGSRDRWDHWSPSRRDGGRDHRGDRDRRDGRDGRDGRDADRHRQVAPSSGQLRLPTPTPAPRPSLNWGSQPQRDGRDGRDGSGPRPVERDQRRPAPAAQLAPAPAPAVAPSVMTAPRVVREASQPRPDGQRWGEGRGGARQEGGPREGGSRPDRGGDGQRR